MESNLLNMGIIGVGHWGPNVIRNFATNKRVKVRTICDTRPEAFGKVKNIAPGDCRFTGDAADIFNDPAIDAVAIITPASTHYPLVMAALDAGKHVFCEKPLALDVEECRQMCSKAQSLGLRLIVGYTFLFNNSIHKLKTLCDSGDLGDIYYLTAKRTHIGLIREDVNALWDLASHDVSIMNHLLGAMPRHVSAVGGRPLGSERHDFGFMSLYYPNGVIGHIHVSWVDSNKERMLCVIGSKSRAVFDDLNNLEPIRVFHKGIGLKDRTSPDFGEYRFLLRDGDIISPKIEMREPLRQMTDEFTNAVLDGSQIATECSVGLDVTRVLCAAQRSLAHNGAPQDVE